jgi:hypothetical protein
MIGQDANKVDNELRFISLNVERAHTQVDGIRARESQGHYQQERFISLGYTLYVHK